MHQLYKNNPRSKPGAIATFILHHLCVRGENIKAFEEEHGKIEGNIQPDVNVKPTQKK